MYLLLCFAIDWFCSKIQFYFIFITGIRHYLVRMRNQYYFYFTSMSLLKLHYFIFYFFWTCPAAEQTDAEGILCWTDFPVTIGGYKHTNRPVNGIFVSKNNFKIKYTRILFVVLKKPESVTSFSSFATALRHVSRREPSLEEWQNESKRLNSTTVLTRKKSSNLFICLSKFTNLMQKITAWFSDV